MSIGHIGSTPTTGTKQTKTAGFEKRKSCPADEKAQRVLGILQKSPSATRRQNSPILQGKAPTDLAKRGSVESSIEPISGLSEEFDEFESELLAETPTREEMEWVMPEELGKLVPGINAEINATLLAGKPSLLKDLFAKIFTTDSERKWKTSCLMLLRTIEKGWDTEDYKSDALKILSLLRMNDTHGVIAKSTTLSAKFKEIRMKCLHIYLDDGRKRFLAKMQGWTKDAITTYMSCVGSVEESKQQKIAMSPLRSYVNLENDCLPVIVQSISLAQNSQMQGYVIEEIIYMMDLAVQRNEFQAAYMSFCALNYEEKDQSGHVKNYAKLDGWKFVSKECLDVYNNFKKMFFPNELHNAAVFTDAMFSRKNVVPAMGLCITYFNKLNDHREQSKTALSSFIKVHNLKVWEELLSKESFDEFLDQISSLKLDLETQVGLLRSRVVNIKSQYNLSITKADDKKSTHVFKSYKNELDHYQRLQGPLAALHLQYSEENIKEKIESLRSCNNAEILDRSELTEYVSVMNKAIVTIEQEIANLAVFKADCISVCTNFYHEASEVELQSRLNFSALVKRRMELKLTKIADIAKKSEENWQKAMDTFLGWVESAQPHSGFHEDPSSLRRLYLVLHTTEQDRKLLGTLNIL